MQINILVIYKFSMPHVYKMGESTEIKVVSVAVVPSMLLLLLAMVSLGSPAVLVTGGSRGGGEGFTSFSSTELLFSDCPVASLPRHSYEHATFTTEDGLVLSCAGQLGRTCYQLSRDLATWSLHSSLPAGLYISSRAQGAAVASGAVMVIREAGAFLPTGATEWETIDMPGDARQACLVPGSPTSVLLIGGYMGSRVHEFSTSTGKWSTWEEGLPESREGPACTRTGDQVFITGGYNRDENKWDGATLILDLNTRRFREGGDLTWGRWAHGIAVLDSRVVAFGGGESGDDEIEEWDEESETWSLIQETMDLGRSNFGSTVIDVNC